MVLLRGVKVLGDAFGELQKRQSADSVLTGVEKIHHRKAVFIKGHTVMALHPTGYSFVIAF
mgnify:CR=1 FL=1